jgi:hypothetical protein
MIPYDPAKQALDKKCTAQMINGNAVTFRRIGTRYGEMHIGIRILAIGALFLATLLTLGSIFFSKQVRTFAKTITVRGGFKERIYLSENCPDRSLDRASGVKSLAIEVARGQWSNLPDSSIPMVEELLTQAENEGSLLVKKLLAEFSDEEREQLQVAGSCLIAAKRAQTLSYIDGVQDHSSVLIPLALEIYDAYPHQFESQLTEQIQRILKYADLPIVNAYDAFDGDEKNLFAQQILRMIVLRMERLLPSQPSYIRGCSFVDWSGQLSMDTNAAAISALTFKNLSSFDVERQRDLLIAEIKDNHLSETSMQNGAPLDVVVTTSSQYVSDFGTTPLAIAYRSNIQNGPSKISDSDFATMKSSNPDALFRYAGVGKSVISQMCLRLEMEDLKSALESAPHHAAECIFGYVPEDKFTTRHFLNNPFSHLVESELETAAFILDLALQYPPQEASEKQWLTACSTLNLLARTCETHNQSDERLTLIKKMLNFLSLPAFSRTFKILSGQQHHIGKHIVYGDSFQQRLHRLLQIMLVKNDITCKQCVTHLLMLGVKLPPHPSYEDSQQAIDQEHAVELLFEKIAQLLLGGQEKPEGCLFALFPKELQAHLIYNLIKLHTPHLLALPTEFVQRRLESYLSALNLPIDSLTGIWGYIVSLELSPVEDLSAAESSP